MTAITAVALLLFITPPVQYAERDEEESESASGSQSAAAAEALVFNKVRRRLQECQVANDQSGNDQEVRKKVGDCINAIASSAQITQNQRERSIQANKNYAADLVLAKKVLRYLTKQTENHVSEFNEYRSDEKKHLSTIGSLIAEEKKEQPHEQPPSALAQEYYRSSSPASLVPMGTQPPFMGVNAQPLPMGLIQASSIQAPAQPWNLPMVKMLPPYQQLGLPQTGFIEQQPSLLQVSPHMPAENLQVRLDREAAKLAKLEANDIEVDHEEDPDFN